MGYAIDADRILKDRQIKDAANFTSDAYDNVSHTLGMLLNSRAHYARKLIETGYEYMGADNEYIQGFERYNEEIKKLLGL